jgi:hypothetical protein
MLGLFLRSLDRSRLPRSAMFAGDVTDAIIIDCETHADAVIAGSAKNVTMKNVRHTPKRTAIASAYVPVMPYLGIAKPRVTDCACPHLDDYGHESDCHLLEHVLEIAGHEADCVVCDKAREYMKMGGWHSGIASDVPLMRRAMYRLHVGEIQ